MADENTQILYKYKETFSSYFIRNCEIDDDEITKEELNTLKELDNLEVFENMKELVTDLLSFKNEAKKEDKFELIQRCDQFENMLQKLEAEVRNHIRIEQQLKLHIDACQGRIDELEKSTADYTRKIKSLEDKVAKKNSEITELMKSISPTPKDISYKIKFLEEKCRDDFSKISTQNTYPKSDTFRDKQDRIQLEHKAKLPEMNHKIRKATGNKIEQECWRLRATIDEKNKEFDKLRKEMDKLNKELKLFKDKRPIHFFKHQEKSSNNPYKHIRTQSDRSAFTDRNNRDQVESRTSNLEIDTLKRTLSSSHMKKISESKVQLKRKQPVPSHNRSTSDTFRTALHAKIL